MSFLREVDLPATFGPFAFFQKNLGFVPNLFRAQTLLPRVIEAEARIAGALLLKESALSRTQKECILLVVAAARQNTYCVMAHLRILLSLGMEEERAEALMSDPHRAGLPGADVALLDFALTLGLRPTRIGREDVEALRRAGFGDEQILEAVLMTGLAKFLCTLSTGLGVVPEFEPGRLRSRSGAAAPGAGPPDIGARGAPEHEKSGPYLRAADPSPDPFPPFIFFRERFGFIPNIFRAQTLRPDVLDAEAEAVGSILLTDDVLTRQRKEYILLVVSAANLNTYCVAVHCEMLRALGVPEETSDQVAVDHRHAGLSAADTALLDMALKLDRQPAEFRARDLEGLLRHGFTEEQALEAVVMTALTGFLNTLQMGLGTEPDFAPRRVFGAEAPTRASTASAAVEDADAGLVARAREGDTKAFEDLIRRHQRRVYRTLMVITGSLEEAKDGLFETFLQAYRQIDTFQGRTLFSVWLTRLAIGEGLRRLGRRNEAESLDDPAPDEGEFRPRQIQAWVDDPETIYSKAQIQALVEGEIMKLPARYRVVLALRDIERLSTEEAAAILDLGTARLRTRLSRGRLMLREALASHFSSGRKERGA
ncbi:MAG TPA: peroxidase-related enzyme [Candidatus Polarisedimenticolia bacterium]|nr:peroxidase-related enzyme [Candidatus Polarisedimenticolia bacterium]